MRRLVALCVAMLASWLALGTTADAVVESTPAQVAIYTYDLNLAAAPANTSTDRGLPVACGRHNSYEAADRWSRGPSARLGQTTPSPGFVYDHRALLLPDDSIATTTGRQAVHADKVILSIPDGQGAANNARRACRANSFTGDTPILMADGTKKPIKDIKLGDKVMATDPVTGESGPRRVSDLIRHGGRRTMVAVRFADGTVINATDHHPFWIAPSRKWIDAIDLEAGDVVVSTGGRRIAIQRVSIHLQDLTAYNLSVDDLHTYFAGATSVLVHNCAMQSRPGAIAQAWGYTTDQIKDAIHRVKNQTGWRGNGGKKNPDVLVDDATGEVYPQLPNGTAGDDSIGNLYDYLPEEP